ncbi:MFS transporter [Xanthomonas albilineans]|uniref:Putative albicidin efflux pump transmembrane protein n=1 Tax=Xanthomonas albilineans (strain GPE PC73 / CFBP 7063) TaxID=380358 RepID=D2UAJ7_XANAP|nr:MFS transporter [Xanthomonas albilineans]QHQ28238.1 putative albicidin efflux pump transmembrane protein [Xanthomonas albilineans]CBA16019.1 putative albicidin efflux pump transmembrane protein [Xanthomonas albilineans GPE PC73]
MQKPKQALGMPPGMAPPGAQFDYRWRWPAMIVLLSANFMNLLDVGIVNVALPSIQKNLGADEQQLEWIVAIYILLFALGLLPLGRLGDMLGRKRMFGTGVAGFILMSAFCAIAGNIHVLIIARALQGLAAAMLAPQVMAIAQTMFAPKERAAAFSLFGLVAGLASFAGPLVSGLLIHIDAFGVGWRAIFLINVPIGLVTLLAAAIWVPKVPAHAGIHNDWVGIALAALALLCLVFPLIEGRAYGWPLWCFAAIALGIPLLVAFVAWQRRQAHLARPALLPIYLMSHRDYILGALSVSVFYSALQGFFLVFVIFLQQGLAYSALETGVATTPFPVGVAIASMLARHVESLRAKIVSGACLMIASYLALWVIITRSEGSLDPWTLTLPLLIGGLGCGITIASLFQTVMRTVPLKDAGAGSGALQVIQQVGGMLGIALVSEIFFSGLHQHLQGPAGVALAFKQAFGATVVYYIAANAFVALSTLGLQFKLTQFAPQSSP